MPSAASRLGGAGFVMDGQWAAVILFALLICRLIEALIDLKNLVDG
jgi:hypothetical protein